MSAPSHFKAQMIANAAQQGVPFATIQVPFSGLLALAGGVCSAGMRVSAGGCSSPSSFP